MKKIQLSIFFVLMCSASFAQFDSTAYVLGGLANYGFTHTKANNNNDDQKYATSSFSFSPSIAKPIKSTTLVGLELGFALSSGKYGAEDYTNENLTQSYSLGIFYQRFYPIVNKVYFNWKASVGAGFNRNKLVFDGVNSTSTSNSMSYEAVATPGISWKVMNRLLLNGSIGGASFDFIDSSSGGTTSFSIFFNRPQFGFSFLLN
ncbi:MAG: hypothetical protein RIF36_20830 [Imperialibacter sp.]|uniref:hypothetical protein n=1 Tax=Imperialibacter sp. TaxID=2038411 RepID=UPI0032ECA3CB